MDSDDEMASIAIRKVPQVTKKKKKQKVVIGSDTEGDETPKSIAKNPVKQTERPERRTRATMALAEELQTAATNAVATSISLIRGAVGAFMDEHEGKSITDTNKKTPLETPAVKSGPLARKVSLVSEELPLPISDDSHRLATTSPEVTKKDALLQLPIKGHTSERDVQAALPNADPIEQSTRTFHQENGTLMARCTESSVLFVCSPAPLVPATRGRVAGMKKRGGEARLPAPPQSKNINKRKQADNPAIIIDEIAGRPSKRLRMKGSPLETIIENGTEKKNIKETIGSTGTAVSNTIRARETSPAASFTATAIDYDELSEPPIVKSKAYPPTSRRQAAKQPASQNLSRNNAKKPRASETLSTDDISTKPIGVKTGTESDKIKPQLRQSRKVDHLLDTSLGQADSPEERRITRSYIKEHNVCKLAYFSNLRSLMHDFRKDKKNYQKRISRSSKPDKPSLMSSLYVNVLLF